MRELIQSTRQLDPRYPMRQTGVAVVTALLLTTLAITIVASLFWQQQVQVRSIENQRMQLQKKWILRGAIDWARLILREDARHSTADYLGEPWAVKLENTRLDQYVEDGSTDAKDSDATLSGQIVDAQASYNLNNLATNGKVDPREIAVFSRLLTNLHLPGGLAATAATAIAQTQPKLAQALNPDSTGAATSTSNGATPPANNPVNNPASGAVETNTTSSSSNTSVQFLRFTQVDDLLAVPGFTPDMLRSLRPYVVVLPRTGGITPVNVNTAPAEVISARIDGVSMGDAAQMIASRDTAFFANAADFTHRFSDKTKNIGPSDVDIKTGFFIVNGKVKMSRSALDVSALVSRATDGTTTVLWVREN
ncbi:type II secretion system minor pseudopilin GspK [Undibacterium sp. Dicai25W]|uniref:type II secretion system minor pseudopilin GspK n=1 Tax=Undibacterium sp. Dicai25W TaxID=3413034 RepID=UPI003BF2DEE0